MDKILATYYYHKNLKPCMNISNYSNWFMYSKNYQGYFGLANVAPTIAKLFNLEIPVDWEQSII